MKSLEIKNALQELVAPFIGTFKVGATEIPAIWIGHLKTKNQVFGLEIQIPEVPESVKYGLNSKIEKWTFYLIQHKDKDGKFTKDNLEKAISIIQRNFTPSNCTYLPNPRTDLDSEVSVAVEITWQFMILLN